MEATASSQQSQPTDSSSRGQRHRRPRRGRGNNTNSALSLRPASIAPERASASTDFSAENAVAQERSSNHSSRGRGRGRARVTSNSIGRNRTVNGRQFGGQLTRQDSNTTSETVTAAQLNGDATTFVPGQQYSNQSTQVHPKPQSTPRKRRVSKSQAPDIATRTHEDIDNGHYECLICMNEVRRNSKVWSCHTCWSVFHLTCIKKWATNEGA